MRPIQTDTNTGFEKSLSQTSDLAWTCPRGPTHNDLELALKMKTCFKESLLFQWTRGLIKTCPG